MLTQLIMGRNKYYVYVSSLKFYTLHSNSKVLETVQKGQKLLVNNAPAACYTFSNPIQSKFRGRWRYFVLLRPSNPTCFRRS